MPRLARLIPFVPVVLLFLLGGGFHSADQVTGAAETAPVTPTSTPLPSDPYLYFPVIFREQVITPGPTPTPTRTRSPFSFTLQNDQPAYLKNFANTAGCNWLGIAGQAFDLNGNPIQNLFVHLEGGGLNYDVFTGDPAFAAYGPAGYELYLGNTPVNTTNTYRIQLRTSIGQPLSDVYVIPTFADCNKNLILANFVQNH